MTRRRRGLSYLFAFLGVLVFYTLVYNAGMAILENDPQPLWHSMRVVVESFTTTGYGSDAPWSHPLMNVLVVMMQFTGVVAVFFALPLFVVPLFENALRTTAPTAVDGDLDGHVVICGYTPHSEVLVEELETRGVEYVIVHPDDERAADLYDRDRSVIHGDPESTAALRNAAVGHAGAVVTDTDDETSASIVLSVREVNHDVPVTSLVEYTDNADYLRYAGADRVLSPEQILGESLADKVTAHVSADVAEAIEVDGDFELAELSVQIESPVTGKRLDESDIRERTGANLLGVWVDGEFTSPPRPDTVLEAGTVILAAGQEAQLADLKELTSSETRHLSRGRVVLAGYGEVGSTIADRLAGKDRQVTVIDSRDVPGVDVVGDATDEWTLSEAGVQNAKTIVLALSDDTETVFATLMLDELCSDAEIIARANEAESTRKLYRAGADYVLALSTVSGRMLASAILDEEVISLDTQVEVVRTPAPGLTGQTLAEADVRARTGCTILGVERDGEVYTDLGPDFTIFGGDEVIVVGTDTDVNDFTTFFGPSEEEGAVSEIPGT